jgi:uncharacterized iron-regulated membrane protein
MSLRDAWRRWLDNPQSVGWRKVLLKVHLWTGLTVGLYIIMISVSGSVAVFRRDLALWLMPPNRPVSGSAPLAVALMEWCADLHDNLLSGQTGRTINGFGAIALLLLILSGAVLWWPGRTRWRRSLLVPRPSRTRRFFWHLHSALAFWGLVLLLGWAVTGIYFAFPDPFNDLFDALNTDPASFTRPGENILQTFISLHFGRFGGFGVRVLWGLIGLLPAVLFITGFVVWWQRRQSGQARQ